MRITLCLLIVMGVVCLGLVRGHKNKGCHEEDSGERRDHGRGEGRNRGRGEGRDHGRGHGRDHDNNKWQDRKRGHGLVEDLDKENEKRNGHGGDHDHDHGRGRGHSHGRGHGHHHRHHHREHCDNVTKPVVQANGDFAFRLYKQLVALPENQNKNVFFSPLSVSLALAALSVGAKGQTHQQLFSGLGFNNSLLTQEHIDHVFQTILEELNEKTGVDLSVGSALFLRDTFKPHPAFLDTMKSFYLSEGFTVNFTDTAKAIDTINTYVEEKTQGKIQDLVKDLDTATVMYLLSYIYFKGKWEIPFDPKDTTEQPFHLEDNTTVLVPMMSLEKKFFVYEDRELSTTILHLCYNDSVSMMLALPEHGLNNLEEVICQNHIAKWHKWMKPKEYKVYIPKLSINTRYSLKDVLSEMGMPEIFTDRANFSGISEELKVAVSEVVHQATLDVDEAGATAAAATGVVIMPLSLHLTPVLKFNRSFMIIVVDRETKSILFMGKVVNPSNK